MHITLWPGRDQSRDFVQKRERKLPGHGDNHLGVVVLFRELECILNRTLREPADEFAMKDIDVGLMVASIAAMEAIAMSPAVSSKLRLSLLQDLVELKSMDLGITQKLRTIERMHRTYHFLAASSSI
ncbi:hypothetical protein CYMTET_30023 [Cymbomonas tetramitiformis]|uniref:Uncharacterized protein n=1 Tax=Cymbomonas tetramitiformis TaxID=36881 RepID=A0AAE0FJU0_9CHLO|nr:hypothetical protein CYMTET_30023 [Cymbomonas tetramitiformis]